METDWRVEFELQQAAMRDRLKQPLRDPGDEREVLFRRALQRALDATAREMALLDAVDSAYRRLEGVKGKRVGEVRAMLAQAVVDGLPARDGGTDAH